MDLNKKRVFIIIVICTLLIGMLTLVSCTDIVSVVKGKVLVAFAEEGETEFDLIEDASLRKKPNFSSKVTGTIKKGTHVKVLVELNKWVKITDGSNEGWVVKQNVADIKTENTVENTVTSEPENVVENNVVPENTVENNTIVKPENTVENTVTSKPESTGSSSNTSKKGVINVDTAKVREEPDGKMIGLVDYNDKVEILGEEGDWYRVNVDEYENCYIAKRLVTIK